MILYDIIKFMIKRKLYSIIVFGAALAFFAMVTLCPGEGKEPIYAAEVAVIFAVYLGFAISGSRDRLNQIDGLLKDHNGLILLTYRLSAIFKPETHDQIRKLIDVYLIEQIDYSLDDFKLSEATFQELFNYVLGLEPDGVRQEESYAKMIDTLSNVSTTRTKVEALVRSRLSIHEWVATMVFLAVTITSLYFMSDGDLLNAAVFSAVVAALILLVVILFESDRLKWDKDQWTWQPLHDLFVNMDLLPYYPGDAVDRGEINLPRKEKIRIARYHDKYPDMSHKVVDVLEIK
jgi:hypothetical protein